jgi:hypothetical protein
MTADDLSEEHACAHHGARPDTLEQVSLLQIEIKAAMNAKAFEDLPKLIARGVCEKANIPNHPELVKAKLIGNIEKGWQEKDAEFMGNALGAAKNAKVDKAVLKIYCMRYKQLSMQVRLHKALENKDTAFLLAGVEMAKLINYTGKHWKEAQAITKKHKFHKSIASIFLDENAAGARKFGSWRDNPAWKLTATAKTMVYIAINEDGKLDEATEVRLQKKQRKSDLKFAAARDKVASTQAASDAEEKNEELKAAAMDAMRVFTEMDQRRRIKKQKIDDGDEDAFTQVGVHVVKNTRLSAFPGVTAGYVDIASCNEYGDDQAWLSFEYDPEMGPLFVVASTFTPGEEGIFTMSFMADAELTLEEVPDFEGNSYRFKGEWSTANQGPRSKKNGDKETGAKFAPEKTWNKNPQYRVWLKDPDTGAALDSATLSIVLSTPIEGAEMGLHIMRNAYCRTPPALEPAAVGALARLASTHIRPSSSPPPLGPGTPCACIRLHMPGLRMPCSRLPTAHSIRHARCPAFAEFYNEKIEILADRYQRMVGKTDMHVGFSDGMAPEIAFDVTLDALFEVKKNGCEEGFPFFIVPSLMDKKMAGPFLIQIISDKKIVIQVLDDDARKL